MDDYEKDESIRMDIKKLQDYYHQTVVSQINKLWKRVKELEEKVEAGEKIAALFEGEDTDTKPPS